MGFFYYTILPPAVQSKVLCTYCLAIRKQKKTKENQSGGGDTTNTQDTLTISQMCDLSIREKTRVNFITFHLRYELNKYSGSVLKAMCSLYWPKWTFCFAFVLQWTNILLQQQRSLPQNSAKLVQSHNMMASCVTFKNKKPLDVRRKKKSIFCNSFHLSRDFHFHYLICDKCVLVYKLSI